MARQWNLKRPERIAVPIVASLCVVTLLLLAASCRRTKTYASGANVDSNSLKQTVVVATLECPLPEHKNAIWCATFQMAWDRFKQDIIGAPIQVQTVQELAERLNRSQFPAGSIEEKSYYATAGFVKDGIIEQVQKEMKQRFPTEPVRDFDGRYKSSPDNILAYAYLNVDVAFAHPYCTCDKGLSFANSAGGQTNVTAFSAQAQGPGHAPGIEAIRRQAEVLYYEAGGASGPAQFAVDLSRETQPYQVILACLPRCTTLGEAAKMLHDKITAFKDGTHHQVESYLQPGDTLIVPNVLYKLTHHFRELLGQHLGNPTWTDYFFFEALQKIDFTLTRTGVVLKSEVHLGAKPAASLGRRRLHFDRPFLICVQKREPNATPFFLMWVDNAELMRPSGGSDKGS
jgi:hypothetical protein